MGFFQKLKQTDYMFKSQAGYRIYAFIPLDVSPVCRSWFSGSLYHRFLSWLILPPVGRWHSRHNNIQGLWHCGSSFCSAKIRQYFCFLSQVRHKICYTFTLSPQNHLLFLQLSPETSWVSLSSIIFSFSPFYLSSSPFPPLPLPLSFFIILSFSTPSMVFSLHPSVFFNPWIFPFFTNTIPLCAPVLSGCGQHALLHLARTNVLSSFFILCKEAERSWEAEVHLWNQKCYT